VLVGEFLFFAGRGKIHTGGENFACLQQRRSVAVGRSVGRSGEIAPSSVAMIDRLMCVLLMMTIKTNETREVLLRRHRTELERLGLFAAHALESVRLVLVVRSLKEDDVGVAFVCENVRRNLV